MTLRPGEGGGLPFWPCVCSACPQELEKAVVRCRELGARLERLQNERERAALERQEFLREQEFQHQRWGTLQGAEKGR